MNINAKLSISRTTSNKSEDYISITVTDAASGCEFLKLRLDLVNFARAVTGVGYVPCDGEFHQEAPVGKVREVKHEIVPRPSYATKAADREKVARSILATYESAGWSGYGPDLFNSHNWVGAEEVRVTFIRFVDAVDAVAPAAGKGATC